LFTVAFSQEGIGLPLKYISSCEIDFNKDKRSDIVFLVETLSGYELIALARDKSGYEVSVLSRGNHGTHLQLSCNLGGFVWGIPKQKEGNQQKKRYKTSGVYITLKQPEGAEEAFIWSENHFN